MDAQQALGALLNALLLYSLGSVHSKKYTVSPKSIIRFGALMDPSENAWKKNSGSIEISGSGPSITQVFTVLDLVAAGFEETSTE
jgi:hypothetical protein